jgi:hypothetical protein
LTCCYLEELQHLQLSDKSPKLQEHSTAVFKVMASSTGIPDSAIEASDSEPLLGRAGDASQVEGKPIYFNLIIGMFLFPFHSFSNTQ